MVGFAAGSEEVVEAGTTTQLNVQPGTEAVNNWAGVYGNVTSQYVVGTVNSTFFSWDMIEGKYVYASSESLNFTGKWQSSNITHMENQYPFLTNGTERIEDTFDTTGTLDSDFSNSEIESTAATTYNGEGQEFWQTIYLDDGSSGFFATPVEQERKAFNNQTTDYQMILPENGFANDDATEYNLYVEVK